MKYGIWIHFINPRKEPDPTNPGYWAPERDGWAFDLAWEDDRTKSGILSFDSKQEAERSAKRERDRHSAETAVQTKTWTVQPIPHGAHWEDKSYLHAGK